MGYLTQTGEKRKREDDDWVHEQLQQPPAAKVKVEADSSVGLSPTTAHEPSTLPPCKLKTGLETNTEQVIPTQA